MNIGVYPLKIHVSLLFNCMVELQMVNLLRYRVTDYTPFFFVKVPQRWSKSKTPVFEKWIRSKLSLQYQDCLVSCKMMKKYDFRGFSNYQKFKYIRLVFTNTLAMRECVGVFQFKYFFEEIKFYW